MRKFRTKFGAAWLPLVTGLGCTLFVALQAPQAHSQNDAETTPAAPPASPLGAVSAAIRAENLQEAARLLKEMEANGSAGKERTRWQQLASRVALRLGDTAWLKEINEYSGQEIAAEEFLVLNAMRYLLAAKPAEARKLLGQIRDYELLSEIPNRRYMQLMARIEQVEGNTKAELEWTEKMVNYVTHWDSKTCQSCHANPRQFGTDVTTFDFDKWWMGERYSHLLKQTGTAEKTVREAMAASEKDPEDTTAKLRLAYALRVTGKEKEAKELIQKTFPWAKGEGRAVKAPMRLAVFP